MKPSWSNVANAVGYQAVWFATLISASKGNMWLGFASSLIFASLMIRFGGKAKQDRRILMIGLILGVSIDTMFAANGWIHYALPWPVIGFAPLWIIALWVSFTATLNHSMAFLRGNYAIAALFGFIGGPLAYFFADRAFNVIEYGSNFIWVMVGLGICWGIVIPGIFYIDTRLSLQTKPNGATA